MCADVPTPPEPISGARLLFSLDPAVAYLNHGSFGAVPLGVQRAQGRLREEIEANPTRFFTQGLLDRLAHTRRHLAAFVGADPAATALVDNATTGVDIVLRSLSLRPGDEVVDTNHGYGAVRLAIDHHCQRNDASRRTLVLPLAGTKEEIVDLVRAGVRPNRTRLLVVDQIGSPTARRLPTSAIVAVARELGIPVLIDAAHAPGMLPAAVTAIGADFWVGNLHKWAYAPRGTALLSVAPGWRDRIEPLAVSWEQPAGFPRNVEFRGTLDYSAWLAAPTGLYTLRTLGVDRVRAHNAALAAYGQRLVGDALGLSPDHLPDPGDPSVAMRVIPLPSGIASTPGDAVALRQRIASELGIEVALVCWEGRGLLRLSGQVYNLPAEYERLAEQLPALLGRASPHRSRS